MMQTRGAMKNQWRRAGLLVLCIALGIGAWAIYPEKEQRPPAAEGGFLGVAISTDTPRPTVAAYSADFRDPFATPTAKGQHKGGGSPAAEKPRAVNPKPVVLPWTLQGIVGQMALVADAEGQVRLLAKGQRLEGLHLVSLHGDHAVAIYQRRRYRLAIGPTSGSK